MNETTFQSALSSGVVMVSDGATGTNLQVAGLEAGVAAETWVLDRPDAIAALHDSFIESGSDIILTCTFGGNRLCNDAAVAERSSEINTRAAQLARVVADKSQRKVFVGGSMGPTGSMLKPLGPLEPDEVVDAYAEQAAALADGGVDFLILETFYDIAEATSAIGGVRQVSKLPLICSFSYDRGTRTMMGVSPKQMVEAIAPLGVAAVGANCGTTPDNMLAVLGELANQDAGLPIWIKPNAGLPTGSPPRYNVLPAEMAAFARRYVALGAQIVGGCCGNTPEHVAAIAGAVKPVSSQSA